MSGRIVVGVDGSDHSRRAVQYALEEARRRDASVDVVHAYQLPVYWGAPEYGATVPGPTREEAERQAREVIDHALGVVPTDVHVERIATRGYPPTALLRIAEGADLLVVGSRGRGGFRGLLLGSTSHSVIAHAPCPVVVVRDATARSRQGPEAVPPVRKQGRGPVQSDPHATPPLPLR